jgi:hypothetical protein
MASRKRPAGQVDETNASNEISLKRGPSGKRPNTSGVEDGMGDFEDEWEDEVERDNTDIDKDDENS